MVMLERLFFFLGDIHHTKLGGADSFSDQLNCKWTVFLLSLFAIISTTRIYVSEPIGCFCPANFPPSQVDYATKYCWATNTHYLPFDRDSPKKHEPRNYISYYQWIPMFLACQALLFYLPRAIWRTLSRKSGITLSNITDAAIDCQRKSEQEGADKILTYMTRYTGRFILEVHRRRTIPSILRPIRQWYYDSYLTGAYLLVKLLYTGNVIGQLFLLDRFLGTDFRLYGVSVMRRMMAGEDWTTSSKFPRVTLCDFEIRAIGNVHRHTVQCTLPLNLYNEMMFIFLWFWFLVVAGTTLVSLICWSIYAFSVPIRVNYVSNRLMMVVDKWSRAADTTSVGKRRRAANRAPHVESHCGAAGDGSTDNQSTSASSDVNRFVRKYLLCDGCFVLRLVASNSSDLIAAQLASGLYDHYCKITGRVVEPPADYGDRRSSSAAAPGGLGLPTTSIGLRRFPSKGDGMQG